jgi:hypothetical protein
VYPSTQEYDGDADRWTPIEYAHYWDFARTFHVRYESLSLVFDSPFLALADEYSDYFLVYISDGTSPNWQSEYLGWPVGHVVPVDAVVLDKSRKKYILTSSLESVCARYEEA